MTHIEQHYLELAAMPSDLPAYKRILELVRKGCADTSAWAGNINVKNGVEHLQETLVERAASAVSSQKLACNAVVTLSVKGTGFCLPFSRPGNVPLASLIKAGDELRSLRAGPGALPGDALEAAGLLLQAAAEIERALNCPPGFTKRQA